MIRFPWTVFARRVRSGYTPVVDVLRWALRFRPVAVPYLVLKAVLRYPAYLVAALLLVKNFKQLFELFLFRNSRRLIWFRFGLGEFRLNIGYLIVFLELVLKGVLCHNMGGRVYACYKGLLISVQSVEAAGPMAELPMYRKMYRLFDYAGRRVLDVGGYCGETAALFHKWGASWVEVYEPSELYRNVEVTLALNKVQGVVHPFFVDDENNALSGCRRKKSWVQILLEGRFDIAKVDCEGCENGLTRLDDDVLRRVPYWVIECHGADVFMRVGAKFCGAGFEVTYRPYLWMASYALLGSDRLFNARGKVPDGLVIMVARLKG